MKALSLDQPWAQLVAEDIKTIETRSWSTRYRGSLAIASTAYTTARHGDGRLGDVWWTSDRHGCLLRTTGSTDPHADKVIGEGPHGHVLATCTLVDVVPISSRWFAAHQGARHGRRGRSVMLRDHEIFGGERDGLWLVSSDGGRGAVDEYIEDQLPYGDFSEGRFAWLLDDIVKLDLPVPAEQGLWNWNEATLTYTKPEEEIRWP